VVEAKYGLVKGGWRSKDNNSSHGGGLWRFISRDWQRFSSHTKLIPGDGSRISFWEELWCGISTLKEAFLGLYNIASNKEASIVDNIDLSSGSRQWNVSFLRSLNDWEVDDLVSFHNLLYAHNLVGGVDKIWWILDRKGKYAVKSFYNVLISRDCCSFPWKSIWRTKALPRVAFFVWSAALGKILTLDNLRKKIMVLVNRCGMCKKDEESVDHLLFIVNVLNSCGMLFSVVLVWRGLCLGGMRIFCVAGGQGVVPVMPWFGKWFRFASCGVYGLNVTRDFSKIPKEAWRISYISFLLLYSLGWKLGLPP
jgi:hypothetical protein